MSLYEDAPGLTVRCITEIPKDMDPSMTSVWKIFNVLWRTQPTHFITVRGSLIPLFYYLYTLYIFRAFSCEIPQRGVVVKTQPLFLSSDEVSAPYLLLLKHRSTFRDYKKHICSLLWWSRESQGGGFSGGASLVESNGLMGTGVSAESQNWGPQSLHWLKCLSGPPQTACGAGGRLDSGMGSSCFAFSSFCGSWDPLPLGLSEIAAGSERETHLQQRHGSNVFLFIHPSFLVFSFFFDHQTNLFSLWMLCCYCCSQPRPWL